jgi:hypothetical protein
MDLLIANLAKESAIVDFSALGMRPSQLRLLAGEAGGALEADDGRLTVPGRGIVSGLAGH